MDTVKEIKEKVHELYWREHESCAKTLLLCLEELLEIKMEPQVLQCVTGLHGAEKFGAQCGLSVAGQMFIGIYFSQIHKNEELVIASCNQYVEVFRNKFGSLQCTDLRLSGYMYSDPRHLCEQLTCDVVTVTYNFLKKEAMID